MILNGGKKRVELVVVDILRIEVVDTCDKVAKDIHIVSEGIERAAIDTAVQTNIRRFGGHEAEVVACLQIVPVLIDA